MAAKEKDALRANNGKDGATGVRGTLGNLIPALRWLPRYDVKTQLREDLICGLTLGVMLIPQGMAYASLAGLRPVSGLYASTMPMLVYCFFGTSKHMSFGPFALISILCSQGLSGVGFDASACGNVPETDATGLCVKDATGLCMTGPESDACKKYEDAASLLSIMAGIVHVLLCGLKLDKLSNLLADPVMTGFTTAAAFIIGTSQVSKFVGYRIDRKLSFFEKWFSKEGLFQQLGKTSLATLCVAVSGLALLIVLQQVNRKYFRPPRVPLPTQLFAVILGIVAVIAFKLDEHGVAVVGNIPSGPPMPKVPDLGNVSTLIGPAIVVAFISFIINTSIAKIFSARFDYPVVIKSELLATGVANIAGGFFLAYPSSGSLSRGAVIAAVGENRVSLLHNLVTAATIILTLVCLTSLFTKLPQAILADIIIMAILKLINFEEGKRLWRSKYYVDCALFWITFILTLTLGVQNGILLSIVISLFTLLAASARPVTNVLGRLPGTNLWCEQSRFPEAMSAPGALAFRFGASLHFANKEFFKEKLLAAEAEANDAIMTAFDSTSDADAELMSAAAAAAAVEAGEMRVKCVIVDGSAVQTIDSSSIKMLAQLCKGFALSGTTFNMTGLPESVKCEILNDKELKKQLKASHGLAPGENDLSDGTKVGLFSSINECLEYHRKAGAIADALPERPRAVTGDGKMEFTERTEAEEEDADEDEGFVSSGLRARAKSKVTGFGDEEGMTVAHAFEGEGDHYNNI